MCVTCRIGERGLYLLCQGENLSLVNSSKLSIHFQVLLVESLEMKIDTQISRKQRTHQIKSRNVRQRLVSL